MPFGDSEEVGSDAPIPQPRDLQCSPPNSWDSQGRPLTHVSSLPGHMFTLTCVLVRFSHLADPDVKLSPSTG